MHRIESDNITVTADGKNQFKNGPPATTVNAEILNALQEEICNAVEGAGISIKRKAGDTHDQLFKSINLLSTEYDIIITNQVQFSSIIERVAANQYKISDDYRAIYMKYATGGYACAGAQSFLSGGDTWGYIETNNCARIVCEAGATFDFADTVGYIEFDTNDGYYDNVQITGTGAGAAALTQSFLLNALRVQFNHCSTTSRLSNTDFVGFQGSGTALHNITSSYNGCSVYAIDGSDKLYGFKDCYNLNNCIAYDIDGTVDNIIGFEGCQRLSNCYSYDLDAPNTIGFSNCNMLSNCTAENITANTDVAYGFLSCYTTSSCNAIEINAVGSSTGFFGCDRTSSSTAKNIYSTGSEAIGFSGTKQISACLADNIQVTAGAGDATGFSGCWEISACLAQSIVSSGGVAWGFNSCKYGAALFTSEAVNALNDWMDSDDVQIANNFSVPAIFT